MRMKWWYLILLYCLKKCETRWSGFIGYENVWSKLSSEFTNYRKKKKRMVFLQIKVEFLKINHGHKDSFFPFRLYGKFSNSSSLETLKFRRQKREINSMVNEVFWFWRARNNCWIRQRGKKWVRSAFLCFFVKK